VCLHDRVRGCVRAIRADRNTRVFLTETSVVADVDDHVRMVKYDCDCASHMNRCDLAGTSCLVFELEPLNA